MDEALKKEVEAMIAAATKPLAEQVGQIAEAGKKIGEIEKNLDIVAKTVSGQKPLTADEVRRLVGDQKGLTADEVKKLIGDADAARAAEAQKSAQAAQAAAAVKAKRDAFAAEKLKGVPARYHGELGDDEAKWGEKEKAIREAFAADLKAAGVKVADVGGSGGGAAPAAGAGGASGGGFLKMPGATA